MKFWKPLDMDMPTSIDASFLKLFWDRKTFGRTAISVERSLRNRLTLDRQHSMNTPTFLKPRSCKRLPFTRRPLYKRLTLQKQVSRRLQILADVLSELTLTSSKQRSPKGPIFKKQISLTFTSQTQFLKEIQFSLWPPSDSLRNSEVRP